MEGQKSKLRTNVDLLQIMLKHKQEVIVGFLMFFSQIQ